MRCRQTPFPVLIVICAGRLVNGASARLRATARHRRPKARDVRADANQDAFGLGNGASTGLAPFLNPVRLRWGG